jgi:PAS domain S-box-containing protein
MTSEFVLSELQQENDRLQAELTELRSRYDMLQKSESRYRQMFENAPISMLLINTDGYITRMNAAAEDLYGLTLNQLNQHACPIFDNPQLVENGTLPYMLRALSGDTVIEPPTYYDASRDFESGNFNYGRGHYFPLWDADGNVEGCVEICPDFKDFFELQQQLFEERDRAAQERAKLLSTVAQVANLLLRSPDYTTVLPDVVRLLGEAVGSDRCEIFRHDMKSGIEESTMQFLAEWCGENVPYSAEIDFDLSSGFPCKAAIHFYERNVVGEVANFLVVNLQEPAKSIFQSQGSTSIA